MVKLLFDDASRIEQCHRPAHLAATDRSPSCQTGRAIVARGVSAARVVTITNTRVIDYQKNGMEARGLVTMNVSKPGTIGPPHLPMDSLIAQNGLVYVAGPLAHRQARPSATRSTAAVIKKPQSPPGGGTSASTAVVLFGATNVTIGHNAITSAARPTSASLL